MDSQRLQTPFSKHKAKLAHINNPSQYKFLVSLGIILIALPIAALIFLLNEEPILISQTDFDALSECSQRMIAYRASLTSWFVDLFPWVGAAFMCLGVILLSFGIYRWRAILKSLDETDAQ